MQVHPKQRRRGATLRKQKQPAAPKVEWKTILVPLLRWSGVVLALAAVGFGIRAGIEKLQKPDAFPFQHVRIEGTLRNLDQSDLQPIAARYLGQNFFTADLGTLRDALAANPWVEQVTVGRWWPNTVRVRLKERVTFAYWGKDEMVDINGQRFRPTVVRQPEPWPKLTGPDGREKELIRIYSEVQSLLEPAGLQLTELVQDERRAWWLTFANGLKAHVGREHFQQRIERLANIYPRVLAAQADRIAVIDLRYLNGFAVRWKAKPSKKRNS